MSALTFMLNFYVKSHSMYLPKSHCLLDFYELVHCSFIETNPYSSFYVEFYVLL